MCEIDQSDNPVCIIGSGLTGLTAAVQLVKAGYKVIILESTLRIGGMAASFQIGRQPLEYIYHHLFTSDQYFIDLCHEFGISSLITWHQTSDAIYAQDRLYPFSGPVDLLKFNVIPLSQRIRTGLTVLRAGRLHNWKSLENMTAADWLRKKGGKSAYSKLWQPLLRSKFDQDADRVSAVWIWNKFKLRGLSRKQNMGSSHLGYMQGGFAALIKVMSEYLCAHNAQILTGHTAISIRRQQNSQQSHVYQVRCIRENGQSCLIESQAVIAAVAGSQFANMTAALNLPHDYIAKTRALTYKGNICLVMRLKRSISDYYWTTICDDLPFVVVVEHTHLTGTEPYDGHIVYLSRYLDISDPLWIQSDGDIFRLFTSALRQIYPAFSQGDILNWRLRRTPFAQPLITKGYSRTMPALDTPDPGIKLAGTAQIYPEDRGMNYAVRLGRQAASAIESYLTAKEKRDVRGK